MKLYSYLMDLYYLEILLGLLFFNLILWGSTLWLCPVMFTYLFLSSFLFIPYLILFQISYFKLFVSTWKFQFYLKHSSVVTNAQVLSSSTPHALSCIQCHLELFSSSSIPCIQCLVYIFYVFFIYFVWSGLCLLFYISFCIQNIDYIYIYIYIKRIFTLGEFFFPYNIVLLPQ